jgi:hypothetical protein
MDVDLVQLAGYAGQTVRVGGLIVDLRIDGLLLDDGTSVGLVILRGAALELLSLLEPDDAINASGRVDVLADGPAVVVDDPGGIVQAGDPVPENAESASPGVVAPLGGQGAALPLASPSVQRAGLTDGPDDITAGLAGLGMLIGLSLVSLVVTLGRRAHARRQVEARIAARVVAFGTPSGPRPVPRSAEHDGSTLNSA